MRGNEITECGRQGLLFGGCLRAGRPASRRGFGRLGVFGAVARGCRSCPNEAGGGRHGCPFGILLAPYAFYSQSEGVILAGFEDFEDCADAADAGADTVRAGCGWIWMDETK